MIHQRRHRPSAFTLIEVVMASGIIAILLVAVQSVIILASHAVPSAQSRSTTLTGAAGALADFDADLAFATSVSARSATSVTFTVPDRNGDGTPETITWSWSGTAGPPLTRTFNNNAPVTMQTNVQAFSLAFDTRTALGNPPTSTSAETLLASNNLIIGLGAKPTHLRAMDKNNFWGQYILPALPSNATSYAVTRIHYLQGVLLSTSTQAVQLVSTDTSNLPTSTILDQTTFTFGILSTLPSWVQFNFTQATNLSPSNGIAITVLNTSNSSNAGYIQSQDVAPTVPGNILSSTNAGSTWTQAPNNSNLLYYVYGTICTPGTPPTLYYLTGCRAALRASTDPRTVARTTVHILNEPQVSGP